MGKLKVQTLDLIYAIRSVTQAYDAFETQLKTLRRRRLVSPDAWRLEVLPAKHTLAKVLDDAWRHLHKRASSRDFPELVREDDVKQQFGISHQTLYRRRRKRELPYVKDKDGTIWYPLYDLLDYVLKTKSTPQRPGRPRKF